MADKKISALTGATTPLVGTEVLPIVQSGSTVKVSIADVTAGRDVTMQSLDVSLPFYDPNGRPRVRVTSSSVDPVLEWDRWSGVGTNFNGARFIYDGTTFAFGNAPVGSVGSLTFTNRMEINATGDVKANTGNLVVGTAGKGIVDSTGTTSLQFTSLQVVSNKQIVAPSVVTATGTTASTPTATPVTLFTPSGEGVWIVNALVTLTGAPAAYIASSMIKASGGVLAATAISTATNMSISVSGANVQATQTSGGDQIIAFSYVRLF